MSDPNDPVQGGFPPNSGGAVGPTPGAPPPGGAAPPPPPPQQPPGAAPAPPGGGYAPPPPGQGGYAPQPAAAAPVFIPELGANLAEPVQRLLARLIDGLIVAVPGWIVWWICYNAFTTTRSVTYLGITSGEYEVKGGYLGFLIASIVAAGIAFAYEFFLTQMQGQTVGKKIMGCQIRRADGQPMDQTTNLTRAGIIAAPYLLTWLIPILGYILAFAFWVGGTILIFTDKRREAIEDKLAKTLVIAVPK